jgi:hypothetical protein
LKKPSALSFLIAAALAGCGGNTGGALPAASGVSAASHVVANLSTNIPPSYRCFPSGLPTKSAGVSPELAYISQCSVPKAKESANLQKLAIAMMAPKSNGAYDEYCTGTPVSYDPATRVGIVVTAAHCVVDGTKAEGANLTAKNIATFAERRQWLYQSTPAYLADTNKLTGEINAVYVPSQYCRSAAFAKGGCGSLAAQNGDVAILKVVPFAGETIQVLPGLQIPNISVTMPPSSYVMALGYGVNTTKTPLDSALYYVDYEYFANNAYQTARSDLSIMNGYFKNGNYYNIICSGDSGGGDFYWDGSHWNLVGAHSWGSNPCGVWSKTYRSALDVSADLRPWASAIHEIIDKDTSASGCIAVARLVCKSR